MDGQRRQTEKTDRKSREDGQRRRTENANEEKSHIERTERTDRKDRQRRRTERGRTERTDREDRQRGRTERGRGANKPIKPLQTSLIEAGVMHPVTVGHTWSNHKRTTSFILHARSVPDYVRTFKSYQCPTLTVYCIGE